MADFEHARRRRAIATGLRQYPPNQRFFDDAVVLLDACLLYTSRCV